MNKIKYLDQDHEEGSERWVISYADLITLLFAFFVVMYAISTVNMNKYKKLTHSLHAVFSDNEQNTTVYLSEKKVKYSAPFESKGKEKLPGFSDGAFKSLFNDKMMKIKHINKDWVEIELRSNMVFKSGDADLKKVAINKLKTIGNFLSKNNYDIIVEGYTDNVPISTIIYPSNWELSASRAAAVVRVLMSSGVLSDRLTAVGYGERFPIADNTTAEGRELNRRVIIVIVRNRQVQRILNPNIEQKKKDNKIPKNTNSKNLDLKVID